ncbi:Switch-associated protein 70, partial [Pseudolycoriella hygida]
MAGLLRNVTNGIWHAFNALQQEEPGAVNKSKLKVLTANIASLFDLYGVEKGLEHFRSTTRLNFLHFRYYLLEEVFVTLPNTITLSEIRSFESKIEEICWLVCRRKYLISCETVVAETYLYKLFRIFCMLSDFISNNETNQCQVLMHSTEAAHVVQQLITGMGLDFETDKQYNDLMSNPRYLPFEEFLLSIELGNYKTMSEYALNEAIEEIYQTYINDVIKKGNLLRRGYLLPSLKEYWFVLQPCELNYYKNQSQKELCGTIILDPNCMVRPSSKSAKADKVLKFILSAGERNFELGTLDHRSRMQWIAALQLAITYSMGKEGFQRDNLNRRRQKRDIEKNLKIQEEMIKNKHLQEAEAAKSQLEQEKLARVAAESQARELEIVAREDSRRVAELEDIKLTLENLLSEESQAKRDEEIVRALQARVLAEEWEKREELEQLQEEQRNLLEQERQKRLQFEITQREREECLKDAERKLKELEEERQRLDLELKQARFKILHSEETKELLEARMQVISKSKDGERVRRALSFMHPNRERPSERPVHIESKSRQR